MRRKDGVDQGALAEASLSNDHDVELKASLEQLVLNLTGNRVETDVARRSDFLNIWGGHGLYGVSGAVTRCRLGTLAH